MVTAIVIVVIVVGMALVYLASLQGQYEVRRSLRMQVGRQMVYDKLRDFRTWQEWSPWLMHEPDTRLAFSDHPDQEGGWYTWDGKRVGAGKLTHVKLTQPGRIDQKIEFTRPFKSVSTVWWELEETEGETEVTWSMRGRMPFLFRFMTAGMVQMIAKDYDLGLAMLRGRLDPQAERPQIEFAGETELEAMAALTIAFKGGVAEMVEAMQAGFPRLAEHAMAHGGTLGPPFTAYHKADPKKMYFECDMAVPVSDQVPDGAFVRKTLGGGKYFKISLQGSYDFLEVTWYSAMAHMRMHKLKMDTSRPSFEVYQNDPATVAHTNEIQTSLYIPIR